MDDDSRKNIEAYGLAYDYLIEHLPEGMAEASLQKYWQGDARDFSTIEEVFERLIASAQSRNMSSSVIGYWEPTRNPEIKEILHEFDLSWIRKQDSESLFASFCDRFPIKNRNSRRNLWRIWCCTIIDGAEFLSKFKDADDFKNFVARFNYNPETREALPLLISEKLRGVGFALACDWLKELGFEEYPKPDVHLMDVFNSLDLAPRNPMSVFEAIVRMADDCNETPYKVDKVFWLICTGDYYHSEGRIPKTPHKDDFISYAQDRLRSPEL